LLDRSKQSFKGGLVHKLVYTKQHLVIIKGGESILRFWIKIRKATLGKS